MPHPAYEQQQHADSTDAHDVEMHLAPSGGHEQVEEEAEEEESDSAADGHGDVLMKGTEVHCIMEEDEEDLEDA